MLKLKLQYVDHLMQRADSLEKTLMLGKTEGQRRRGPGKFPKVPGRRRSLDQEDPLDKGMITHSSILAWRIPWTEEPGGL